MARLRTTIFAVVKTLLIAAVIALWVFVIVKFITEVNVYKPSTTKPTAGLCLPEQGCVQKTVLWWIYPQLE